MNRKTLPFWLGISLTMVALVASAILLVDYVRPAAVFCDAEGGCGAMKRTIFAYPLGIPTPFIGIGGFLAIGLAQMTSGRGARFAQVLLSALGAVVAAGLIAVQVSLHTICPYCAISDSASLLLLVIAVLRLRSASDPPPLKGARAATSLGFALAAGLPIVIGMNKKPIPPPPPPALPDVIAQEMKKTPKGKVTVVDFVDYECPFCRMTHQALGPVLAARADKVRVVRKNVPLRMHVHAMDAAKAACCGEKMGKANEMTEALFAVPPEGLTPEGCEAIAVSNGLDAGAFRDCLKDPGTEASIRADVETFHAAGGHGLPTLFVDSTMLVGSQDGPALEATIDAAIKESSLRL